MSSAKSTHVSMMDVSNPIPLARLPRNNRLESTHFGPVYTLHDVSKKRRKEICAAVDGDSLSIYEIQNGTILASYPVPPSSHFLGQPYSIREKIGGQTIRTTYCGIKRDTLCVESFKTSGNESERPTVTASSALRDQESPIALLEVMPAGGETHIIVLQRNGTLTTFSADLQTKICESSLASHHCETLKILAAHNLSRSDAKASILKQRPDLVSSTEQEFSYLAVAYGQTGQDGCIQKLWFGVWPASVTGEGSMRTGRPCSPLFEHPLSLAGNKLASLKEKSCKFGSRASSLFVRAGNMLLCYELTGMVPSVASTLCPVLSATDEVMAISSAVAICSSHDSLRLYDLKYQSIQAHRITKQTSLKRKRNFGGYEGSGPIEFVAYYPQSARIIGKRRHQLLAIDVSVGSTKGPLNIGSKLIQNIGRGVANHEVKTKNPEKQLLSSEYGTFTLRPTRRAEWELIRQKLDKAAQAGDIVGFEGIFLDHISEAAVESDPPDSRNVHLVPALTDVPDFEINYLLSKLFQPDLTPNPRTTEQNNNKQRIKVQLPSEKLMLWVARIGLLSSQHVESVLAKVSSISSDAFASNGIAEALVLADPSLDLLVDCLKAGFSPYVHEQASVIQLLLRQALDTSIDTTDTASVAQINGTMDLGLPKAPETNLQILPDPSPESASLPTSLQTALIAALDRLGTATYATISSHVKGLLSERETLALIQFLRQQLFLAGHTRSFQSVSAMEEVAPTVRLDSAVKVLSSCIDAIGPLGFFGALDNEEFIGNIIPELVTEITNTKRGLEDVSELQGILREALRYPEAIQRQRASGARIPAHITGEALEARPGAIVTVYSEAFAGDDALQPGSALPLSLKIENAVTTVKMPKGGGGQLKKRSGRQVRMLERVNKSRYSFERLVL